MHNEEKIKADKIALIYEFNNDSPLFCRVAAKFIDNNEIEKAISLLETGLKKYQDYTTALILYSICLAKIGKKEIALEILDDLSKKVYFPDTINYYRNKIVNINEADSLTEFKEDNSVNLQLSDSEEYVIDEELSSSDKITDIDELEELALKLKNASIPPAEDSVLELEQEDDEAQNLFPGKSLVSETLAKIYFNQGNFQEALSIYETLIEIQPEMKEYYQRQVDLINSQMNKNI